MDSALKCVFCFSVLISLFLSSSAKTCGNLSFPSSAPNRSFRTCLDLSQSSSYLHWTYDQSTGNLDVAYRHNGVTTGRWVAWALNPTGSATAAMPGAHALVAFVASNGTATTHTLPISGYSTMLAQGDLSFPVSDLRVTYQESEVIIFATITLSGDEKIGPQHTHTTLAIAIPKVS
ncbi:hypothetical protein K1719_001583 [Acacia pycnantha]|nr:hypothetical protein K1719_001583 [Acacia pycnantha]